MALENRGNGPRPATSIFQLLLRPCKYIMRIEVSRIELPAKTSIGLGYGIDPEGGELVFCGDHRPMRELAAALSQSHSPVHAVVDDWQVFGGSLPN
jgi:hypothetical protein